MVQPGCWACRGATEWHVPASQGLTRCGPLEKEVANHFRILALRTT